MFGEGEGRKNKLKEEKIKNGIDNTVDMRDEDETMWMK